MDHGFERAQAFVDRQEFDHRCPGAHQILERGPHLPERIQDLVHEPERDRSRHDRRSEHHEAEDVVDLQVEDPRDVEVHVVEIQAKIIPPDIVEQFTHGGRIGPAGIVLAVDEFLAVGGLDTLVAKFQPGQADADHGQKRRAHDRPQQGRDHQRMRDLAEDRHGRHTGREMDEHRQEGDQRHHGVDQADAEELGRRREAHGVFLDTLRGAFDLAQPWPVRHVVAVHRLPPAKDIVADEEARDDADHHRHQGDAEEGGDAVVEFADLDRARPRQRRLQQVVEGAVPVIDGDAHLHLEIGDEEDERGAEDRPPPPRMRRHRLPEGREQPDRRDEIEIEPEEGPRPEPPDPDECRIALRQADMGAPVRGGGVPERHAERSPDQHRPEEGTGTGKEGNEQGEGSTSAWAGP